MVVEDGKAHMVNISINDREALEGSMGELDIATGGGRPVVRQPALGGQPVLRGARSIIGQLVQLGVPVTALGTSVVWFDHKPEADRRSAALQPARRTIPELQAALLHRELRQHRRIAVEPCTFTAQKLATSLRYGNGQKRLFASTRGKLHAMSI